MDGMRKRRRLSTCLLVQDGKLVRVCLPEPQRRVLSPSVKSVKVLSHLAMEKGIRPLMLEKFLCHFLWVFAVYPKSSTRYRTDSKHRVPGCRRFDIRHVVALVILAISLYHFIRPSFFALPSTANLGRSDYKMLRTVDVACLFYAILVFFGSLLPQSHVLVLLGTTTFSEMTSHGYAENAAISNLIWAGRRPSPPG